MTEISVFIIIPPPLDGQLLASLPPPLSPSPLGLCRCNILNERKRVREFRQIKQKQQPIDHASN